MIPEADPVESKTAKIEIRPTRATDAAAVYALRQQPNVIRFTLALPSDRFEDALRRSENLGPDDHVLVAEVVGRVVGVAGLHVKPGKQRHCGEVGMMIHDVWQGRGIGHRLLEGLLVLADDYLGLVRVELEVRADNPRAVKLYESCGFEHEGRKRAALMGPEGYADLLVMARLRLPG